VIFIISDLFFVYRVKIPKKWQIPSMSVLYNYTSSTSTI